MAKKKLYRYTDAELKEGKTIEAEPTVGDPLIKTVSQEVEKHIAEYEPKLFEIRNSCIYTHADESAAKKQQKIAKKKNCYELEVEEADILFEGDLCNYNDVGDCVQRLALPMTANVDVQHQMIKNALRKFAQQEKAGDLRTPIWEVLVSKAKVIKKV